MAGTRGQQLNVADLYYGIEKTFSGGERYIWNSQVLKANDIVYSFQNVVTPINHQPAHEAAADAALTVTPTIIKKQIIVCTPTAARNFTTSTAAVIIDGLFGGTSGTASHELYEMYKLHIVNAAAATYAITLVGGSGVTVVGSAVVAANSSAMFDISLASSTTISALRAS